MISIIIIYLPKLSIINYYLLSPPIQLGSNCRWPPHAINHKSPSIRQAWQHKPLARPIVHNRSCKNFDRLTIIIILLSIMRLSSSDTDIILIITGDNEEPPLVGNNNSHYKCIVYMWKEAPRIIRFACVVAKSWECHINGDALKFNRIKRQFVPS